MHESVFRTPRISHGFPTLSPLGEAAVANLQSASDTPLSASSLDFSRPSTRATGSSLGIGIGSDCATPELPYSPFNDGRRLNQTYSLPNESETLDTLERASPAPGDQDWAERGAAMAVAAGSNGTVTIRRTVKDFEFCRELGEGSYSTVVLAIDRITKMNYAVKVLDKRHIIKEKKVKYVNIEKHALNRLSGLKGIISLFFTFQDKEKLYFVLELASNGELLGLIRKYGSLNEDATRYFAAQILDVIKNIHDNGIIHRDIKPENILIDGQYRIRITDFGTAKLLERKKNHESGEEDYPLDVRAKSFVGTAEYVSPELLESKYCGKPGDIWAFGCLLYQLIAGKPPFKASNEYLTFQKITKLQYAFSAGFPLILRDLIKQILVLRPSRRATIDQIQKHAFFERCNFKDPDSIWNARVPEFSAYKMTAQSMMKMPPKSAPPAKDLKVFKKKAPRLQGRAVELKKHPDDKGARNFTPASVAAYVLTRDDETSQGQESAAPRAPLSNASTKSPTTPDYIPGTNILRPQVNTMAKFSRGSTSSSHKSEPERKAKPKPKEVPPPSALEAVWLQYLTGDERVIHVGSVTVCKQTTEEFEKKHKGLVQDTPLGFNSLLKTVVHRSTSRSMLSRYVKENQLRKQEAAYPDFESDAITFFHEEVLAHTEPAAEDEERSLLGLGVGRFKSIKKLLGNDKKQDASQETVLDGGRVIRRIVSLDKPRPCTVLITTFGRVLLLLRNDARSDYKLVCEVKLKYPFIHFKEVLTSSSIKFGKHIPASGIFVIISRFITFEFKVGKYEVNQWTDALARAKLSVLERADPEPRKSVPRRSSLYNLLSANPKSDPDPAAPQLPCSSSLPQTLDPRKNQLVAQKRTCAKEALRRRVQPPPVKNQQLELNGLTCDPDNGEKATVHAAQLAISSIGLGPAARSNVHRASSFIKESVRTHAPSSILTSSMPGNVTSINSKLLARSRSGK
ncbi:kinase-like protein [Metschnikowia bicuspidata]|uniref:non-specific serine/threonine protein kinase n=1 Tax=Metschnikowia bicuspidata TaxID=27322 RepID=A0A4P9ZEG5_9ASCO|nr:kinase-like protein [Metschnikowia bicuspidata]